MEKHNIIVGGSRLECLCFGESQLPPLLIDVCLAGSVGEWFHLAEKLSEAYFVLLYSRGGYGNSSAAPRDRSLPRLTAELREIVLALAGSRPVTLVGHSFGGLVVHAYARTWPESVAKAVFIDPMTFQDNEFRDRLSPAEFAASGVDKSANLRIGRVVCAMRLGWLLKPLLRKGPPFFYKPDFDPEASRAILRNATRPAMYRAALDEYSQAHDPAVARLYDTGQPAGRFPVVCITHGSEGMIRDIQYYGSTDRETAMKVETLWQELMEEVLMLSSNSRLVRAGSGSHFLHLSEPDTVLAAIRE